MCCTRKTQISSLNSATGNLLPVLLSQCLPVSELCGGYHFSSVQLGPNVSIGTGVTIGAGVRVRESIILHGANLQVSPSERTVSTRRCV